MIPHFWKCNKYKLESYPFFIPCNFLNRMFTKQFSCLVNDLFNILWTIVLSTCLARIPDQTCYVFSEVLNFRSWKCSLKNQCKFLNIYWRAQKVPQGKLYWGCFAAKSFFTGSGFCTPTQLGIKNIHIDYKLFIIRCDFQFYIISGVHDSTILKVLNISLCLRFMIYTACLTSFSTARFWMRGHDNLFPVESVN